MEKVIVKAKLGTPVFGSTYDHFSHTLGFSPDVAIVDAELSGGFSLDMAIVDAE